MKTPIRSLTVLVAALAVVALLTMATPPASAQGCVFVLNASATPASCESGGDTFTVSESHNDPGEGWVWQGATGTGTFGFAGDTASWLVVGTWRQWITEGHWTCPDGYDMHGDRCRKWDWNRWKWVYADRVWVDTSHWGGYHTEKRNGTVKKPNCYTTCSETVAIPGEFGPWEIANGLRCHTREITYVDAKDRETVCSVVPDTVCEGVSQWCVDGVDTWVPDGEKPVGKEVNQGVCTACQKNPNQGICAWHWYCNDKGVPTHTNEVDAGDYERAIRDTANQVWVCTVKMCDPATGVVTEVFGEAQWQAAIDAGMTGDLSACQTTVEDPGEETGSNPTGIPVVNIIIACIAAAALSGLALVKVLTNKPAAAK